MAYVPSSVLSPPRQPLGLAAIVSVGLHVGGVVIFAGWTLLCGASKPIDDIRPSIPIDFALVAQADGLPQLAMRMPTPQNFDEPTPPAPAPEPQPVTPEPPPPRESDLVRVTPEPTPVAPAPVAPTPAPDNSAERQRALERMRADQERADLLEQRMADIRDGPRNQDATDPNGNSDVTVGSGVGNPADRELALWRARTEALFAEAFSPIQSDPSLRAVVRVNIVPNTGEILGTRVLQSSGNQSFDAAAERSAMSLQRISPAEEKYRSIVGPNLDITYVPK